MKSILCLLASLCCFTALSQAAPAKPNLLFILADDLGYGELGAYGQEKIRTPRIDALAAEGMKFTRAYAGNAVCAPSRCVLMTSKHPGHATVRSNAAQVPEGQYPLKPSDVTLATLLKNEGYSCGAFGKWGLGNIWSTGSPERHGFDRFFGYNCQSRAHTYYPKTLWSDRELVYLKNSPPIPGHESLAPGSDPTNPKSYDIFKGQDYSADLIHEQAIAFLKNHRDQPFFLFYPSTLPHVALQIPDKYLEPYLAENWEDPPFTRETSGYTPHFTPRAAYAAMITRLDTQVGELVDLVEELGLSENTLIVFTSDNGPTHIEEIDTDFFKSAAGFRGMKGDLYEGGVRIPQIARWKGKIAPGTSSDHVTGFEDWLPTVLDLFGHSDRIPAGIDGVSFASTLLGETQKERPFLYREFPGYRGQQAVWLGHRWKGIRTEINPPRKGPKQKGKAPAQPRIDLSVQLYDLEADPAETKNVAAEHPEIVKEIEGLMKREHEPSEGFPFPALDRL